MERRATEMPMNLSSIGVSTNHQTYTIGTYFECLAMYCVLDALRIKLPISCTLSKSNWDWFIILKAGSRNHRLITQSEIKLGVH